MTPKNILKLTDLYMIIIQKTETSFEQVDFGDKIKYVPTYLTNFVLLCNLPTINHRFHSKVVTFFVNNSIIGLQIT